MTTRLTLKRPRRDIRLENVTVSYVKPTAEQRRIQVEAFAVLIREIIEERKQAKGATA